MEYVNTIVFILDLINYELLLFYGTALSVIFAGGCTTTSEKKKIAVFYLLILSAQAIIFFLFGLETTEKLYPLITHIPLVLMLIIVLKQSFGVALASITTSYFCCQLPKWFGTAALFFFNSSLAYDIGYLISLIIFFFLLRDRKSVV